MGVAVAAIGVMVGIVGVIGVVSPAIVSAALDGLKFSPPKMYGLAVARLVIGVVLILGASSTASTMLVQVIGAILILRAAAIPILGLDRIRSLIEWWQACSPLFMRILFLAGTAFGVFLVQAAIRT